MNKIPFILVTGFLGSGKTTFLKNILDKYSNSKKIAIIQNEFAPANVDSLDLKLSNKNFEILEINRGSVFCVCLLNDFISSLDDFIKIHSPDILILEASGLADPITIAELVESPILSEKLFLSKVYTVVDSINFDKLKFNTRVIHQIRIADKIIINKIDQSNKTLEIEKSIADLNPYAEIISTSYCKILLEDFLHPLDFTTTALSKLKKNESSSNGRPEIVSKVLRTRRKFAINKIKKYFSSLDDNLFRIKGYLNSSNDKSLAIQFVFGNLKILEINNYQGPALLIAMGNKGYVTDSFNELLKISD